MLSTKLLTFIFATSAGLVSAQDPGQISCQTSNASPSSADAQNAIKQLEAKGGTCTQNHGAGTSQCTTMIQQGTARLAICGADGLSIPCETAATDLQVLLNNCANSGAIGGSFSLAGGDSNRVEIYHS